MKYPTLVAGLIMLSALFFESTAIAQLNGEWMITRGTMSGELVPLDILQKMSLKITGTTFDAKSGDSSSRGQVTEAGAQGPFKKAVFKIDSGDDSGREIKALYQRIGTTLKISFSQNSDYPKEIRSTSDNQLLVLQYKNKAGNVATRRPGNGKNLTLPEPSLRSN